MKYSKENISVFAKREDDSYRCLLNARLTDIKDAVLPDGDLSGHCVVNLELTEKHDADFLYSNSVELMARVFEHGRLTDPKNGMLICSVVLNGDAMISYHSNDTHCWKLSARAEIVEWG